MKEYLLNIVSAVLLGILADITISSARERNSEMEKITKAGITVCVLAVIVLPVVNIGMGFDDIKEGYDIQNSVNVSEYKHYLLEKEAESEGAKFILEKTGVAVESVDVKIEDCDNRQPQIAFAQIMLDRENEVYEQQIRLYAQQAFGKEVNIQYVN